MLFTILTIFVWSVSILEFVLALKKNTALAKVMSLVVHIFSHYPEFGTNTNFDLVTAVNDKSGQMYDSG